MAAHSCSRPTQRPKQWNQSTDPIWSIFVGNISYQTSEQELRSFFDDACGHVSAVSIVYDNQTRQSRGFGFVQFGTMVAYEMALALNGNALNGRQLKISPNKSRGTFSPAPAAFSTAAAAANKTVDFNLATGQKTRVVHCKKSTYDVYIGRPSIWGNPFIIGRDGDKTDRLGKYRTWIMSQPELIERAKKELRGRTIACWCKPEACHGDILAELADAD